MILVIKVVCGNTVLRCSPLKRALCAFSENLKISVVLAF
nr:acetyltransferase [Vibrio parahaemolyticus]